VLVGTVAGVRVVGACVCGRQPAWANASGRRQKVVHQARQGNVCRQNCVCVVCKRGPPEYARYELAVGGGGVRKRKRLESDATRKRHAAENNAAKRGVRKRERSKTG